MVRVPTHGELYRTVADLMKENKADRAEFEATVGRLQKRVDRLEQENATLRSRLDKNSKNSSKPPSSDSFHKPASRDRSLRESSGRPQGKQAGSAGVSLPMTQAADRVLRHEPSNCRGCGSSLRCVPGTIAATRQVRHPGGGVGETDDRFPRRHAPAGASSESPRPHRPVQRSPRRGPTGIRGDPNER